EGRRGSVGKGLWLVRGRRNIRKDQAIRGFLQGLKPSGGLLLMSELKLRPTKASAVVDFRDEPEGISFDVQHGKSAHGIRRREHLQDFHKAAPSSFFGDVFQVVMSSVRISLVDSGFTHIFAAR